MTATTATSRIERDRQLRTLITQLQANRPDLTLEDIARASDLGISTFRSWHARVDGKELATPFILDRVGKMLQRVDAGEILRVGGGLEDGGRGRVQSVDGGDEVFLITRNVRKVTNTLSYCKEHRGGGLITGFAGLGKSEGIHYWRDDHECVYIDLIPATGGKHLPFLRTLADALHVPIRVSATNTDIAFRAIVKLLANEHPFIVLDEAHYMSPTTIDWMRKLHDHAYTRRGRSKTPGFGYAMVGLPYLLSTISRLDDGGNDGSFSSRIIKRAQLAPMPLDEMREALVKHGIRNIDAPVLSYWHSAVRGSLRNLTRTIALMKMHLRQPGAKVDKQSIEEIGRHLLGLRVED